jgi:hypothetical protein
VEVEWFELEEDKVGRIGRIKDGIWNSCLTISRSCRVTKISWRRVLVTLLQEQVW